MTFAFSAEPQQITVNHFDPATGEFIVTTSDTIAPHTGLPANSTNMELPAARDGYARVFNGSEWEQVEDNRGTTVYVKASRLALVVGTLGALLDTVTTAAPTSDYDVWNATTGAWELDAAAQLADEVAGVVSEQAALMQAANQQIEIWTDAVAEADATDTDTLMLAAWKSYRVKLNKVDTSAPENISWPSEPTAAAVTAAAAEVALAKAAAEAEAAAAAESSVETASTDTNPQA